MANRMDEIVATGAGKLKGVEARLNGVVGIFNTLTQQHREASSLMGKVKEDASKRASLWPEIRKALVSHERGELQVLYPELRLHSETRAFADRHDREAHELDELITRIHALDFEAPQWGSLFDTLVDKVTAHATEEETEIFPSSQDVVGGPKARDLDAMFGKAQEQIKATL